MKRIYVNSFVITIHLLLSSQLIFANTILVTGGTGYIGSHVAVELLKSGHEVVIDDDLRNSKVDVIERIEKTANKKIKQFYKINLTKNYADVDKIFKEQHIFAVIHLAGLKSVKESTEHPLTYYRENLVSSMNLLDAMISNKCMNIVFSSSATVYGNPVRIPIDEKHPVGPINPYGRTKLIVEQMFEDQSKSRQDFHAIALRYFNPIGAHPAGHLGERPLGTPNNLMPYILDVIIGKQKILNVFTGYETKDGSGVRDYLHVVDLAKGHIAALKKIERDPVHFKSYNLGTGTGYSTKEIVAAVDKFRGIKLPVEIKGRRPGDADTVVADPTLC